MTDQQLAKLAFLNTTESRRSAKRYLHRHAESSGAAALDAALAVFAANPAAQAIYREMIAKKEREAREAKDLAEREEVGHKAGVIAAVANGRISQAIAMLHEHGNPKLTGSAWQEACGGEHQEWVVTAYAVDPTPEEVASEFDVTQIDFADELEEIYQQVCGEAISAEARSQSAAAIEALKNRATKDGRYVVCEYYRKTMGGDNNCLSLAFADRDDAVALLTLLGDYSTSSYNAVIFDTEERAEV